ncbi:hypothetical protein JXB11_01400 [Candidatus Woesearchaeota archaeon]|nr:hypothetical protein [Candidatus Woesearchaeota archaeon]
MRKAQMAVEYTALVVIVLTIIVPAAYLFFSESEEDRKEAEAEKIADFANNVVTEAERLYYMGPGAKTTINEKLPAGVKAARVESDTAEGVHQLVIVTADDSYVFNSVVPIGEGFGKESYVEGTTDLRLEVKEGADGEVYTWASFEEKCLNDEDCGKDQNCVYGECVRCDCPCRYSDNHCISCNFIDDFIGGCGSGYKCVYGECVAPDGTVAVYVPPGETLLFYDGFESGGFDCGQCQDANYNADESWYIWQDSSHYGPEVVNCMPSELCEGRAAYLRGGISGPGTYTCNSGATSCTGISHRVNTEGYENIELSFSLATGADALDNPFHVQFSATGGVWQDLDVITSPPSTYSDVFSYSLPAECDNNYNVQIRFWQSETYNIEFSYIDEVLVTGTTFSGPSCTDDCTGGATECTSNTHYRECGNYDADACLEWSPAMTCASGFCNDLTNQCGILSGTWTYRAPNGAWQVNLVQSAGNEVIAVLLEDIGIPGAAVTGDWIVNFTISGLNVIGEANNRADAEVPSNYVLNYEGTIMSGMTFIDGEFEYPSGSAVWYPTNFTKN